MQVQPVPNSSPHDLPATPAALIVAHPGHEMRVHGWLCRTRPLTFVLTDGSGHGDQPRTNSTARVLTAAGAESGSVFGRLSDRAWYRMILEQRVDALARLVDELARGLADLDVGYVVSDAAEGFNPVHDLCYVTAMAAVDEASKRLGRRIEHFDFLLDAAPDARLDDQPDAIQLCLSDDELQVKLDEARSYPELRSEVRAALESHGVEAFRCEVLYPAPPERNWRSLIGESPAYERFGARRVEQGIYADVLGFREHFAPLVNALLGRFPSVA